MLFAITLYSSTLRWSTKLLSSLPQLIIFFLKNIIVCLIRSAKSEQNLKIACHTLEVFTQAIVEITAVEITTDSFS